MDQGLTTILGVILGAGLASARDAYDWYAKRRRYETAVAFEIRHACRMIDEKIAWLQRALPEDVLVSAKTLIVDVNGEKLYLGEPEQFFIQLPFWQTHYKDLVSVLSTESFYAFAETIEIIEMFQSKFKDMKTAFAGSIGDPHKMAAACYQDLLGLYGLLKGSAGIQQTNRLVSSMLPQPFQAMDV